MKKKQLRTLYPFPVAAVTSTTQIKTRPICPHRHESRDWESTGLNSRCGQGWFLLKTLSMFLRPNFNSSWDLGYVTFGLSSILTSPLTGSSKQHQFTQVTWGDQSSLRFLPLSYYTISCSYWVTPTGSGVPYVGDSHSAVMGKDGDGGGEMAEINGGIGSG